ncbi:flagellar export protein FliJ [Devosia pacifica]|uniref:Flagellar FliJ protein n=2 Tax=Devosia pacifica TaxID=1335967 RepID=A0A918S8D4_9HYPH|nr:flagellar export protein FliJ [Devosia pacifica]
MMVADFERMATELDQQIEIEHQKTGISDVAHFAYSTFAKAAAQRRDNLLASANDMRHKLEAAQDALAEAVEDLKKVELLDQRETQRESDERAREEQAGYDEIARLRQFK